MPWLSLALLLAIGAFVLAPLSSTWSSNANYSFGWWIPVVCLILLSERWPLKPSRRSIGSFPLFPRLILWGLIFLVFRLAAETDPDWRLGLWVLVSLYVIVLMGWLWLEGGLPWVRHFAFPIGFLFLCVPWPFVIEYPLVQGLMRWNAVLVAVSLQGLGIFAEPTGNIIQMQNAQLGVEEACSGILSLQASLVMGFLLGDIYRLTAYRRLLLVLSSMLLALAGNYLRTFFLALMAFYSGPEAVPQWHDTAGYAILIFTAVGSWMAALAFSSQQAPAAPIPDAQGDEETGERRSSIRYAVAILCMVVLAEAITQAWFGWRDSKLTQHPEWSAQMPVKNSSYKAVAIPEVTLENLRCDQSMAGRWRDEKGADWNTYWFQYEPKPYTRTVLSWHVPDKCLPSVGLVKDHDYPDFETTINGINLYVHPKRFSSKDSVVYVFWLVYALQGDLPWGNYNYGTKTVSAKLQEHLVDLWKGYRGVGVETLEVAIIGPKNYDEAKAGYLTGLSTLIQPKLSPGNSTEATSR